MLPRLVPEIEGGYPERDGEGGEGGEGGEEGEGLVLEYSRSWIYRFTSISSCLPDIPHDREFPRTKLSLKATKIQFSPVSWQSTELEEIHVIFNHG